jgi:ATPase subunit of ABC transporter with duplicated ATPase domains
MIHHPITLSSLNLIFTQKVCFTNFSSQIHYGQHIGIIGQNGCGKSTLLKMLCGLVAPQEYSIFVPENVSYGYVAQVIENHENLSGGQRFSAALTQALAHNPNVLLLDEPTNHLDASNRLALMRLLRKFPGTLVVISHDVEILRNCVDILWHIDQGKITIFAGNYDDYMSHIQKSRHAIEKEIHFLGSQKKQLHKDLMKEQQRAKKSRLRGERQRAQGRWPTLVASGKKRQAQETMGRNQRSIELQKQRLVTSLVELRMPEIITPTFSIQSHKIISSQTIVSITEGSCRYDKPLLDNINLSLGAREKLAIVGDNGTGKSTLLRAILQDDSIIKEGDWLTPERKCIGYLDQHYITLNPEQTVMEAIKNVVPNWCNDDIRRLLNDFLFRKNEEVMAYVSCLSGGEKARLTLAQIAAQTPKLLLLDELTNNLDLETRNHVVQVLRCYPGALIVISHDQDFLKEIGIQTYYDLGKRRKKC